MMACSLRISLIALVVPLAVPACDANISIEDGEEEGAGGSFEPCCLPGETSNDRCASPQSLDLSAGTVTIEADTSIASDEFPGLTCESPHVAFSFDQAQLYYRFSGSAGRRYDFSLTSSFYGFVYVFPEHAECNADVIEAACSTDGVDGMVSGIVNPGSTGTSWFEPSTSASYILVVDGDTSSGPFTLTVSER
jgi:hypothetical protein